jgi:biopolymer transport protein ExbD
MRSVVVFLSLIAAAPVLARSVLAHEVPTSQTAQAPAHNPLDCYCRAQGKMFAPGEKVCLRTAEGPKLALCQMEINVMSWSITEVSCPET